jgi:hypothetical protein
MGAEGQHGSVAVGNIFMLRVREIPGKSKVSGVLHRSARATLHFCGKQTELRRTDLPCGNVFPFGFYVRLLT